MSLFAINLLLALLWMLVTGTHTLDSFLIGFILGYAVLAVVSRLQGGSRYHLRLWRILALSGYFLYELFISSLRVMWDIVTPKHHSKPGFIAMPLDAKTDVEIFFTANLISLTPGTLSIAVSEDRRTLFIHVMFLDDMQQTLHALKAFEARVLEAFR